MKRDLQRLEIPGEYDARRRTWDIVRRAYVERDPISWPRRHARELAFAGAAVAVVAAAVTPPGRSVVDSVRRTIGVEHAQRELVRLPASGRILVDSRSGTWIVQRDGSRRLLGPYHDAAWSPHGLFVAAVAHRRELVAVSPKGTVRWVKPEPRVLRSPRWSYEGYRIAYLAGSTLRVINGDGTGDRRIGAADPHVAPAWQPGTHTVAWIGEGGDVLVKNVDERRTPGRTRPVARIVALGWTDGELSSQPATIKGVAGTVAAAALDPRTGRTAVVVRKGSRSSIYVGERVLFSAAGRLGGVAWSPNGRWLAVAWPRADQLVFIRVAGRPKLLAFSDIARQFGSSPSLAGWSR